MAIAHLLGLPALSFEWRLGGRQPAALHQVPFRAVGVAGVDLPSFAMAVQGIRAANSRGKVRSICLL